MPIIHSWITTALLLCISQPGLFQYPFPVYPPPLPPPPPQIFNMPPIISIHFPRNETTTTTTTTTTEKTESSNDIVIQFPPPMGIPLFSNPLSPPPSPFRFPYPINNSGPPVVVISYPNREPTVIRPKKQKKSNCNHRKSNIDIDSDEIVKPVLSYVTRDGDVKFKTPISNDEAAMMVGNDNLLSRMYRKVRVSNMPSPSDRFQDMDVLRSMSKKTVLRDGADHHILKGGKKELVFSPTSNKKISDLSLSFVLSE